MNAPIVQASEPVLLVGGGDLSAQELGVVRSLCGTIVAADGGADQVLGHGLMPDAVIGDLDSISEAGRRAIGDERLFHIAEQDSTDFDKCLRNIAAPMVIGLGFLGRRVDHQLSVMNTLVRRVGLRCLLLGRDDLIFHAPPEIALSLDPGTRLSLFPMAAVRGQGVGLTWPIEGIDFSPDGRTGTSNRVQSGDVRLKMSAPGMLVLMPPEALGAVVRSYLSAAPWSVPAR